MSLRVREEERTIMGEWILCENRVIFDWMTFGAKKRRIREREGEREMNNCQKYEGIIKGR